MDKKAQMSWIVKAIIAVIVLVILIAVFYGVGGKSIGQLGLLGEKTTTGADIETVKATCNQLCNDARLITDPARWKPSQYCSNSYAIDMNTDGTISEDETGIKCFDPMIGVYCTATLESWGVPGSCDRLDCESTTGCPYFACKVGPGATTFCTKTSVATTVTTNSNEATYLGASNTLKTFSACEDAKSISGGSSCSWQQHQP